MSVPFFIAFSNEEKIFLGGSWEGMVSVSNIKNCNFKSKETAVLYGSNWCHNIISALQTNLILGLSQPLWNYVFFFSIFFFFCTCLSSVANNFFVKSGTIYLCGQRQIATNQVTYPDVFREFYGNLEMEKKTRIMPSQANHLPQSSRGQTQVLVHTVY